MSIFKSSKQSSKRTKLIVFGYIHEHEAAESINNIPLLISYMCLSYCPHDMHVIEFFSKARNDYFEISKDKLTVTNIGKHCHKSIHTIYCNKSIDSTSNIIVKWKFYIKKFDSSYKLYFALTSINENEKEGFCLKSVMQNKPYYEVDSNGYKYSDNKVCGTCFNLISSGDTVELTLDLTNLFHGIFSMQINNRKQLVLFDDIKTGKNIKYKMALQLHPANSSVTLKSYDELYHDPPCTTDTILNSFTSYLKSFISYFL
eukprot:290415_1